MVAAANGLQVRYLVLPFGVRLTPREWYGLAVITSFYNTLTPFRGGMLAKAAYLKRRHRLPLTGFLALTAGTSIVNLCVAGVAGLAGLGLIAARSGPGSGLLAAFFAAAAAGTTAMMLFTPQLPVSGNPLLARIGLIVDGWRLIRGNTAVLGMTWLATGLQYVLAAVSTVYSFRLIGVAAGFDVCLVLASLTSFSALVALTPAGLGVTEAVAVFAGLALGITPAESLAAAVARRLATTGVILVLGPLFTFSLLGSHRRARPGEEENP